MKDYSSLQRKTLLRIKDALKNSDFEDVDWPKKNNIENFIWVGFQNQLIGRKICHYEFIFHPETPNFLTLEVHFEIKKHFELFQNLILSSNLTFDKWINKTEKIIFKNKKIKLTDKSIVTKSIALLSNLHKTIGNQLIEILQVHSVLLHKKYQKPILSNNSRKVAMNRFYGKRICSELGSVDLFHGRLQEKLIKKLNDSGKYEIVNSENGFENYYYQIDVLAKTKKNQYDIFEVKPYPTATACIRAALGQLLHYKYLLDEGGYQIGTLYIVGPVDLSDEEKKFLKFIKKDIKIEYKSIK